MGLLEECQEHFKTDDLYEVFRVDKHSSATTVKKAYYKLSMIYHPDKVVESENAKKEATIRFQILSKIYGILSDKEARQIYDETGAVDEEGLLADEDSFNVWRKVFKKVTKEDIDNFFAGYKNSKDEEADIITAYERCDGDMDVMLEYIMLSSPEEETRVKRMVDRLIDDGTLNSTKKYKTSTKKTKVNARSKKAAKEAKEAAEMLKEIEEKEGTSDLQALILKRQADRGNSFFDALTEKYAPKAKKSKK